MKKYELVISQCGNFMREHHDGEWILASDVETIMTDKPNAGRPAPLGRKKPVGIRLTPDVIEFCKQHPDGFVFLEALCRKSKEFRAWVKSH